MTEFEWIMTALSVFSVLLLPAIVIMIRGAIKWTRTEDKLSTLIDDVRELVDDKEKVHGQMLEQMRVDRQITDKRLRYLEEFWMDKGHATHQ